MPNVGVEKERRGIKKESVTSDHQKMLVRSISFWFCTGVWLDAVGLAFRGSGRESGTMNWGRERLCGGVRSPKRKWNIYIFYAGGPHLSRVPESTVKIAESTPSTPLLFQFPLFFYILRKQLG